MKTRTKERARRERLMGRRKRMDKEEMEREDAIGRRRLVARKDSARRKLKLETKKTITEMGSHKRVT